MRQLVSISILQTVHFVQTIFNNSSCVVTSMRVFFIRIHTVLCAHKDLYLKVPINSHTAKIDFYTNLVNASGYIFFNSVAAVNIVWNYFDKMECVDGGNSREFINSIVFIAMKFKIAFIVTHRALN